MPKLKPLKVSEDARPRSSPSLVVKLGHAAFPTIPHPCPEIPSVSTTTRRECESSGSRREVGAGRTAGSGSGAGKEAHPSHVSGFAADGRAGERSPVRGPEAGGAIPGHRHKGPRRVEAAHQAPHVQLVARERAAQPVASCAARHGQRGSGAPAPGHCARLVHRPGPACTRLRPETRLQVRGAGDRKSPSAGAEGLSDTAARTRAPEFIIRRSPP